MVSKLLSILFILPIIYAKIEIDISATDEKERDVRILGSYVDWISEAERTAFDLTDENLKKAISTYFGWSPDSVYLRNPTPWGGLYKTLNWEPVRRVFLPTKAAILSVESKPILVSSKDITNQDTIAKTFNENINQEVETIVSSKWENKEDMISDDIHYHLDMKKPEDTLYFDFTAKLGEEVVKKMPLMLTKDFQITLKPKQNAKLEVFVTQETMKIKVHYQSSLTGSVAMNYDKEYKGHRFWAMDVNTVLDAGAMRKEIPSWELIEVVHYTDAKFLVKDLDTQEVLYTAPLSMN